MKDALHMLPTLTLQYTEVSLFQGLPIDSGVFAANHDGCVQGLGWRGKEVPRGINFMVPAVPLTSNRHRAEGQT